MKSDYAGKANIVAITLVSAITSAGITTEALAGDAGAFVGGMIGGHLLTNMANRDERRTRAQEQMASQPRTVYVQQQPAAAPASSGSSTQSVEQKLQTLDRLAAGGYITKAEYKRRRQAILDSM